MKKIFAALLIIVIVAIGFFFAFPEKIAGYFIDYERGKAGLVKKEIKIDDHKIVYLEGGRGTTILMLHGYSANKDNWPRFAAFFTNNYHVVIPDLPGHGESSQLMNASYDAASQIERLHKFRQAVKINKFHIVGNSMGGWFAGAYAVRYPDDVLSVGLFDAAGVQSLEKSEVVKLMEKGESPLLLKDSNDFDRLMKLVFVNPPRTPYPFKKMFIKQGLANRPFNEKIAKDMAPGFTSLESDLPKIEAPALILWGDQDKILDISSVPVFEKGLKNYKTVIIKDCGHAPMLEKPKETSDAYLSFIRGIGK
ncbi:MAG TPA: alpha/beta hydrolase [Smithellaceae bacterium]|nr:alpha/beta hydrolase [Smithellaceae bacterium]